MNPVLPPGDVVESVTVSGDTGTVRLETSDASVSTLISPTEVNDLPLPSRDPMNLMLLVPGYRAVGRRRALRRIRCRSMAAGR